MWEMLASADFWFGASSGFRKEVKRTNFAEESGSASSSTLRSGMPVQGTVIAHASTQRKR